MEKYTNKEIIKIQSLSLWFVKEICLAMKENQSQMRCQPLALKRSWRPCLWWQRVRHTFWSHH